MKKLHLGNKNKGKPYKQIKNKNRRISEDRPVLDLTSYLRSLIAFSGSSHYCSAETITISNKAKASLNAINFVESYPVVLFSDFPLLTLLYYYTFQNLTNVSFKAVAFKTN
uniref:Uncharacterized protein n=1 Tax=Glossina brevipalpis TaxID=37001 RepID=A0A1A9WHM6_9MUSC